MTKIALISADPLAAKVFPKLLSTLGFETLWLSPTQSIDDASPQNLDGLGGVIADCRIRPELVVLRLVELSCWSVPLYPVAVLHHQDESAMKILGQCLPVHAIIDAAEEPPAAIIGRIAEFLHAALEATAREGASEATNADGPDEREAPRTKTKSSTNRSMRQSAKSSKKMPRSASGPTALQSTKAKESESSRKLQFHRLYNDSGLLTEEAGHSDQKSAAKDIEAGVFQRKRPARFSRRFTQAQTVEKLSEFAEARPLKSSVQMALKIARDSSATVDDLARVVKQDQALAARVLKLSNSSIHRRGAAVRTVEQAIVRLGMATLRETISSTAILDQFGSDDDILNIPLLWEHGYAVGMLAADIARKGSDVSPDEAFMIGLMHDMGRAVMSHQFGQDYIDALLEARRHDMPPDKVEKQFFESNHSDVAETVFKTWDFDAATISPIANHHLSSNNLKHLDPVHFGQTKMLQLADTIAHASLLGDSGSDWIDTSMLKLKGLTLDPGLVRTSVQRASKTLDELRLMAHSVDGDQTLVSCADALRAVLPDNVTLASIGDEDVLDPMDLLTWRLGGRQWAEGMASFGDPVGPSDQADVLLGSIGKRADISRLLKAIEAHDTDDRRIPVILSATTKALTTEVRTQLDGRRNYILPGAFRVAWVLRMINHALADQQHEASAAA